MKRIFPMLLGLPFLAVGLWLLGTLAGAMNLRREIRDSWLRVPATVVAHESIAIGIHRRFHRPTVRYAYEHEGARYENYRHDLLEEFPVVSPSIGRRGRLPYTVGQAVTAYVNPKAPFESVLSLELQYTTLIVPCGLMFVLIGGAFVVGPLLPAGRRPGLGALVGVAALSTILVGLMITEAGAWSVPAAIVVAGLAAGTGALARLLFRQRTGRT